MSDSIGVLRVIGGRIGDLAEEDPRERGYRILAKMCREAAEAISRLPTAERERSLGVEERDAA